MSSPSPAPSDSNALNDRVAIVTGGTDGIGRATAQGLAQLGARVIIVGRDFEKGAAAAAHLNQICGAARVEFLRTDLASLAAVRTFAGELLRRLDRLDLLINNAGVYIEERATSADGFEMHFAVNHLAPFLLTNLLLDRLRATPGSRVVNVSSFAHRYVSLDLDDLQTEKGFSPLKAYNRSKLANVLFTRQLTRLLDGNAPTVNAVDPGPVRSALNPRSGILGLGSRLIRPFLRSPEQGARTSIRVATSLDLANISGRYFSGERERQPSRQAQDDTVAARLWERSAELTGGPGEGTNSGA